MSVTFGSVGDIISVCLLVKDLVTALDKTRGSKAEYQAAIRDLWILERVLLEIELLTKQHGSEATAELRSLWETANQAVSRCKRLIGDFLARIRKYKTAFEGDDKKLKEAAMGIRWRIGEKEALEQFRVEIAGTSSSLQMLLVTASVTLLGVNRKEMNDKFDEAKRINDTATSAQDATLERIKDRIDIANQNIEAGNSVLGKFTEALRLNWLRQLGSELKSLMCGVAAINFATYQAVNRLQAALPSPMERGLIEEPAILEDVLGRISPIHLQFITSWDAFHAVIESRFRNLPGYDKIKRRHYDLRQPGTVGVFNKLRPFQSVFLPGKKIEMEILYRLRDSTRWHETDIKCPYCDTTAGPYTEDPLLCKKCLEWFQYYVLHCEEMLSGSWEAAVRRIKPGAAVNRKRSRIEDADHEEDPRTFKRVAYLAVHMMCTGGSVEIENRDPSDMDLYNTKQPRITEITEPSDE